MTSKNPPNCLIRQSACDLQTGQTECPKCGMRTDARYVSQEGMDMAVAKGTALYWQNHAQALERAIEAHQKAQSEQLECSKVEYSNLGELIDNQYQVLTGGRRVKDIKTGLVWQRYVVGQSWDGETCSGVATQFRFDQALQTAGHGWRLPTLDELKTLVNKKAEKPTINQKAFPVTPPYYFWTSTKTDVGVACVSFSCGDTTVSRAYMSSTFYVRLVQEFEPASASQTLR